MQLINDMIGFEGRLNRKPYWLGVLFLALIPLPVGLITGATEFGLAMALPGMPMVTMGLVSLVQIPLFAFSIIAGLCLGVKRCHDRSRSGWFLLIALIPVIAVAVAA